MKYIDNSNIDPYFNLAAEEYFLRHKNDEYFILWRDEPCVIVGKNQNTLSEIDMDYIETNNVKVVRRQTGGGAVFHDLGNLNYTFIVKDDGKSFNDFERFCKPIIGVLKTLGVKAEFSGRNDLLIDGKKISGTAQCKYKNRVMHHGTLLFSSDIVNLSGALKPKKIKFQDKAVKSVISRITNISEHLDSKIDVLAFKNKIFDYILKSEKDAEVMPLTQDEIDEIEKIKKSKYETWAWNFGSSPKYDFYNEGKFTGGTIELTLKVEKGIITDIKIFGDFFGVKDVKEIEDLLKGTEHKKEEIKNAINNVNIYEYFARITMEEFISLF
ncbi:lipoate--protein ligase [Clostridium botulinum]|uniref:lipoate--protein ligase n=1 Tax=Clostridium botulinum TaxID=1491 RepID=A0A6G4HR97_CLOBO|nr:lipoate--protein ligase [Clostridium botulinum]MBD5586218.1 lipoate--protein ligase [Clostridium botulinum]MBO0570240.1 lipoate--protein ligase [Clostridium botulinum]MBO0583618.1 lipoate--protein ligase [Clostridium botulinum]NFJ59887.1 lipoate--protein ligase [Clostridium botulinum]NFJ67973.1 lipoate--protein ligase [Clostridium botulinum]